LFLGDFFRLLRNVLLTEVPKNMAKVKLYIASSLDGYIAAANDNLDWLTQLDNPNNIDHNYAAFMSEIGSTVMGSVTYRTVVEMGIEWPYLGLKNFVWSRNPHYPISTADTKLVTDDIVAFVRTLKSTEEKDIWIIGGGQLIAVLLSNDLIEELTISVIPVILGKGTLLFQGDLPMSNWKLKACEAFETEIVNLTYIKKASK
jgi:dihydrofolate reductase